MSNFEFNKETENWVVRVTVKLMVISFAMLGVFIGALTYGEKVVTGAKKLWTGFRKKAEKRGYTEMELNNEE